MQVSPKFRAAHPEKFQKKKEPKKPQKKKPKVKPKPVKSVKPKAPKPPKIPKSQEDWEFGIPWHRFPSIPAQIQKRQWCARWGKGTVSAYEHRKHIIRALFPEERFAWHEWVDRRLKAFCESNFVIMMGPAASAKTTDMAVIALEWWLEAPHESAVVVCSTTKDMLKKRIWGKLAELHGWLNGRGLGYIGELLDASNIIRWKAGDWTNAMFAVAVDDGPVEDAVNNIIGVHPKRILWVLDEMQGVNEAVMKAIPNLLKNPESRMVGMGNPTSFTSLLGRYIEPIDGWKSVPKFTEQWEIHSHGYKGKGIGLFFDGRKSPAVLDPEWGRKHDWMINQEQIDQHRNSREVAGNENNPEFMTQSIGWPPSMGLESTLLDAAIVQTYKCTERAIWTDGFTRMASLDPAFNGGDDAVLTIGKRGFVKDPEGDRWILEPSEQIIVPIDAESQRTIHYQILDFCRAECERRGIRADEFSIAAAGEGGGLVSIFQQEWGPVIAIEEGGAASERVVDERGKTAKESYDNRSSELNFGLRNFALGNGIRGLPFEVVKQASERQTFMKNGKWCIEPKTGSKGRTDASGRGLKGFKERMGYSPDECDSVLIFVEHARLKGADPAFGIRTSPIVSAFWNSRASRQNDEWESSYEETNWSEVYST